MGGGAWIKYTQKFKGHRFFIPTGDIKGVEGCEGFKRTGILLKAIKLIVHDIDNIRKMNQMSCTSLGRN